MSGIHGAIIIASLVIFAISWEQHDQNSIRIEFIGLHGCPNAAPMLRSLKGAMRSLGMHVRIIQHDEKELAQRDDLRSGFGSPTILVNGADLFGLPTPPSAGMSCRYYPNGLPGIDQIKVRLQVIRDSLKKEHTD